MLKRLKTVFLPQDDGRDCALDAACERLNCAIGTFSKQIERALESHENPPYPAHLRERMIQDFNHHRAA